MNFKTIAVIGALTLLIVSMSGCTSQSPTTGGQTSQVLKYAEAWKSVIEKNNTDKNVTLTFKTVANGTDAVRMTVTSVNKTKTSSYANGTTTTMSLNIKEFANKDDAKKFFDDVTFGYTAMTNSTLKAGVTESGDNPYVIAIGREPTMVDASWKIDSFTFVTMGASLAIQQDEFVTYGTISMISGN